MEHSRVERGDGRTTRGPELHTGTVLLPVGASTNVEQGQGHTRTPSPASARAAGRVAAHIP